MIDLILCTQDDLNILADLNKQLIEDEKSDNKMNIDQLKERMSGFLETDYNAYLFKRQNTVVGYALVKKSQAPIYLRQFFICRQYRKRGYGREAFNKLMHLLGTDAIDIEVLCWNNAGKLFWDSLGFKERSVYMRYNKD